jgi:peptidoglycan/xylan/chitin deacetylase (PgdA/CDA1 family)
MPPLPHRRTPPTAVAGQVPFIPILMYHYVRNVDPTRDRIGYGLSVSPAKFAAQMDWLYREGYTTLRMETVARCLSGLQTCPPRSVALTFDDGYEDAYRNALPVLQHYNFVATFYIVTDFVGYTGYMNWEQLRAMRDAGMEIGAHSNTHLDLTSLDPFRATEEIAGSGQRLARELQTPITSFCYPGGQFNLAVKELVRQAGYATAVTTQQLFDQRDLLALPRARIQGEMSQQGFEETMRVFSP